jgi:hypothetical protein
MVTMMDVGVVWVGMRQARVLMAVRVGFAWRIAGRVFVLVMLVVIVKVFVLHRLVNMLMLVAFGNVQPDAYEHENSRETERPIQPTLPEGEGERSARERRSGKIGPCSSCAEMTERPHEKNETDAIAEETDDRNAQGDGHCGKFRADGEGQSCIGDACAETLPHCNLRRVPAGDFACEVVVNSPTEAGCGDEQRAARDGKITFLRE